MLPPHRFAPRPNGTPPQVPTVTVDVPDTPGGQPKPVTVPGRTPEEAFRFLYAAGGGLAGEGARDIYQGTVLEPVRVRYKARLQQVESEIVRRRAALGANPAEGELRALAVWAARQRANTARLYRIPQGPGWMASLEARDWDEYGVGGRTFKNLLRRNQVKRGLTGPAAYEYILGSAVVDNATVTARTASTAKLFRGGGAALGVAGLAVSAYNIYTAPPGQRVAAAEHEGVDFAGGLVASEAGVALLGVGAALLAATPPGWLIIGVGLVAGAVGSYVADRMFYPEDYKPVAGRLAAGVAVNPSHRYGANTVSVQGLSGHILLPNAQLGDTVPLTIGPQDTEGTVAQRALRAAAQAWGLDGPTQDAFVRRHANDPDLAPGARTWSNAPNASFPRDGKPVNPQDFVRMRGQAIAWPLTGPQMDDLQRQSAAGH